jgi:hypothetical protein
MTAAEKPALRRVGVIVTATEWRALRIAAASHDTSVQGYVTSAVLRRLRDEDSSALRSAKQSTALEG